MKRVQPKYGLAILFFAFALVAAACSSDTDDQVAAESDATEEAPPAESLALAEIDFTTGTVTIKNEGDAAVDMTGLKICQAPDYGDLPSETLEPGATVSVAAPSTIAADSGEIGIYADDNFGSAASIVSYVEWGESGHQRSTTAIEAGIWSDGEFVDSADATILTASAGTAFTGADWTAG